MNQSAVNEYKEVGVSSGVTDANPHQLIAMLLSGCADRVSSARGAVLRGEVGRKGELISSAIAIIDNLRASLDRENGGEVASNLGALYDYIEQGLVEANIGGDAARLEEVGTLLAELKAGWGSIPVDQRRVK